MTKKGDKSKKDNLSSYMSEEDAKLWHKISETAKPLESKKRDRLPTIEIQEKNRSGHKKPQLKKANNNVKSKTSVSPKPQTPKTAPPITDIDHRKKRKLGSEQIEIQATLDLHGYRQEQAHTALKSFIRNAQAQSYKYVLVITGKGTKKKPSQNEYWQDDYEPGMLKRNVPEWLSDSDLRNCVVGYSAAHQKHGGEGALYVQIRKLK